MSVYFVDSDERNFPAVLPSRTDTQSPDILVDTDLHRRERQHLTRNLVTCERSLQKRADRKLETFKCQQALNLLSSDAHVQQKDKLKALDIRIARSVHLPVAVQENIASEKSRAQEEMSQLIESLDKKSNRLEMQIKQDTFDFDRLRGMRMSLRNSLSAVDGKSNMPIRIQYNHAATFARDMIEGLNNLPQLAQFLQIENAYYLYDCFLSLGITSVEKLMSLKHEDIRALNLPETDLACLLRLIAKGNHSIHAEKVRVLSHGFAALFPHRTKAPECYSGIYEKLKTCLSGPDLSTFKNMLSRYSSDVVNFQDDAGWTLLHRAALKKDAHIGEGQAHSVQDYQETSNLPTVDVIQSLLLARAEVHLKNKYGRTALHYAAMEGNVSTCLLLIEARAHIADLDSYGMSPMQHASLMKKGCWKDVCHLLSGETGETGKAVKSTTRRISRSKSKRVKKKGE
uniref:Uncharacterized protein n=1 Tax=Cryptomonas curvata TaxID=233186 RepID=A0A7S0M7Q2_9CRYP|mmetsp:Transcript_27653/g.57522  ORF Transcript_27653/g.57522 Transcript_27653/m.57522 type:complete len:456 (+) Transcript_27653:45-1412(+)